jgi:hypothetical protein
MFVRATGSTALLAGAAFLLTSWAALDGRQSAPTGYVFSQWIGRSDAAITVDGSGAQARFSAAGPVAVAPDGVAYVADQFVIRRVSVDGVVTTFAGGVGQAGDTNGPRLAARFRELRDIAVSQTGVVFVADNHTIRTIGLDGQVRTLAGVTGMRGLADGVGGAARFTFPTSLAPATDGSVYVAEPAHNALRRVTADGTVTTIAGTTTSVGLTGIRGVAVAPDGNLWVSSSSGLNRLTPSGSMLQTLSDPPSGLNGLVDLVIGSDGDVFMATNTAVRRMSSSGVVSSTYGVVAHGFISGFALTSTGEAFVSMAQWDTSVVADPASLFRFNAEGTSLSLVAGGFACCVADGPAATAVFGIVTGGVRSGALTYVADLRTIKVVDGTGTVSTVAGTLGASGYVDDTGAAARFGIISGVVVLPNGDLAVADKSAHAVRRVTPAGVVTTIAGGTRGSADGTGAAAQFDGIEGLAVGPAGQIYVSDGVNRRIRMIDTGGVVTTVAGTGVTGVADGPGASATFFAPRGLAVGGDGVVYVADGTRIRTITSGIVATLVSSGYASNTAPQTMVWDLDGSLLVMDGGCRITRVTTAGTVSVVGGGCSSGGNAGQDGHSSLVTFGQGAVLIGVAADGTVITGETTILRRGVPQALTAPVFLTQPASVSAIAGQEATFTVSAPAASSFVWEVSTDAGETWTALADGGIYNGALTATLSVPVTTTSLSGTLYRARATNTSGTGTSGPARLEVVTVVARPDALRFSVVTSGTHGPIATVTSPQDITIATASGTGWTATVSQPWVQLSRTSASGTASMLVSVIDPGTPLYTGGLFDRTAMITVTPTGGGSPIEIPVNLQVFSEGWVQVPWGVVDTPVGSATVRGAVPVTGWALDNVGIRHVRVYRACVSGEPSVNCQTLLGQSLVYIGDAVRVPGARFEGGRSYPEERSAGWGYMLLTNMLPRTFPYSPYGGQGQHRLWVIATDLEGHSVFLGSPILNVDNDAIAKPFGTIDSPGQGERVSGTIPVFGWALTPDPGSGILIPTDGSTTVVYVDGIPVGLVAYNQCRGTVGNPVLGGAYCNDDVSNIFGVTSPQAALTTRTSNPSVYRNLDVGRGAIGSYVIDTSTMTNGLHSLAWSVTDSDGRVEGIGSRNFEVLNGATDLRPGVASTLARSGVVIRRTLSVPERLEVVLDGEIGGVSRMVNGVAHALPAGMSISGSRLMWAPAPGYQGEYEFALNVGGRRVTVIVEVR